MRFTENDIRPEKFDEAKNDALREDLERLESQKSSFIDVSCPACGSVKRYFAFEKYSFNFVCCEICSTIYMNPRATPEILNDFYNNSVLYEFWNRYIFPASREIRREKIFKPRIKRILDICQNFGVPTHCLIEIGAGFGIFCEEAINTHKFQNVIAVEPNAELAASCEKIGIEVIADSIENITHFRVQPDIIALFEVIEHLFSPEDFLNHCNRLMSPDSIIVVTCPNYKGFDIEPLAEKSESIDAEHINMFNPDSLTLLFERCGFITLEVSTPGELDAEILRKKVLKGEHDLENQPFLRTVLLDRWDDLGQPFQEFLKQHKLSSHLWVVARKN